MKPFKFPSLFVVVLLLGAGSLFSACSTVGYDRASFLRVVSTNSKFTARELKGEAANVIWGLGYRKDGDGKWKRQGETGFILVELEDANPPTIDISLFVRPEHQRQNDATKKEVTEAIHTHFSRRMALNEVKLLRGIF